MDGTPRNPVHRCQPDRIERNPARPSKSVTVQQLPRHAVEPRLVSDQPCRTVRTVMIPNDRRSDAQPEAYGDDDDQSNNQNKAIGTAVRLSEKEIGQESGRDRQQ